MGGSLANNDPAACYPSAVLALGGTIKTDRRSIAADDFFQGMFTTALEQGEIITSIELPIPQKSAYEKFRNPGVALCHRRRVRGEVRLRRAAGDHRRGPGRRVPPHRDGEGAVGQFLARCDRGIVTPADGLNGDIHASAEYRAHLIGVVSKRAVAKAV